MSCSAAFPEVCCACDEGCVARGDCCCDHEIACFPPPPSAEECDGVDNDDDGFVDEGCPCNEGACGAGLECVTPFDPTEPSTCHPPCADFCGPDCTDRPDVIHVADYGMLPGDGLDDYAGFQAIAAPTTATPAGVSNRPVTSAPVHVVFQPGTYDIDQYIDEGCNPRCNPGLPPFLPNGIEHIKYTGAHNVHFHGCQATIDVLPTPPRNIRYTNDANQSFAFLTTVSPFRMESSSSFSIDGFEIDGNTDEPSTSRAPTVVEHGGSTGITTADCSDYEIRNVEVHHFASDGISLGLASVYDTESLEDYDEEGLYSCPGFEREETTVRVYRRDHRGYVSNVNSHHNARGGLGIIQIESLHVGDSRFAYGGVTDNAGYPGHAPKFGVQVEPDRGPPSEYFPLKCSPKLPLGHATRGMTESIVLDNVTMEENLGVITSAPYARTSQKVHIDRSTLRGSSAWTARTTALWFQVYGVTIDRSTIDLGDHGWMHVVDHASGTGCSTYAPTSFALTNSSVDLTTGNALLATLNCPQGTPVTFSGNLFTVYGPSSGSLPAFQVGGTNTTFEDNEVRVQASRWSPDMGGPQFVVRLAPLMSRNNDFSLVDPPSMPSGSQLIVAYSVGPGGTTVDHDHYPDIPLLVPQGAAIALCPGTTHQYCR